HCGFAGADPLAGAASEAAPPTADPLYVDSVTSGVSGFMLSISFSTGIVAGAGCEVRLEAPPSGVCMGMPEFDSMNGSGYFNLGTGAPAGMGCTISGVTITISSVLDLVLVIDWKNL